MGVIKVYFQNGGKCAIIKLLRRKFMDWFDKNDKTNGVITAKKHLASKHKDYDAKPLPENAMIFCLSKWEKILQENFDAFVYMENLKRFLGTTQVFKLKENENWCFLHGGAGAPQIADTIETIHELGVKRVVLVGMVGGFGDMVNIGDVVVPNKILVEEGTSLHYGEYKQFVEIKDNDEKLIASLKNNNFNVWQFPTVTTDAVYRQTFAREEYWRTLGCVGVDMEASATVSVCDFYNMKSKCIFMVSDKHPKSENEPASWKWGMTYEHRTNFICSLVNFYLN
jgi:uridine phosphorylase